MNLLNRLWRTLDTVTGDTELTELTERVATLETENTVLRTQLHIARHQRATALHVAANLAREATDWRTLAENRCLGDTTP